MVINLGSWQRLPVAPDLNIWTVRGFDCFLDQNCCTSPSMIFLGSFLADTFENLTVADALLKLFDFEVMPQSFVLTTCPTSQCHLKQSKVLTLLGYNHLFPASTWVKT